MNNEYPKMVMFVIGMSLLGGISAWLDKSEETSWTVILVSLSIGAIGIFVYTAYKLYTKPDDL